MNVGNSLRAIVFVQLGLSLFCLVTAYTSDELLVAATGKVPLPIIGAEITLRGFALFAPLTLLAVNVYLNLLLSQIRHIPTSSHHEFVFTMGNPPASLFASVAAYWLTPATIAFITWQILARPEVKVLALAAGVYSGVMGVTFFRRAISSGSVFEQVSSPFLLLLPIAISLFSAKLVLDRDGMLLHRNYDLFRARLTGVNLSGMNLSHADLQEANLENAVLGEAKFVKANLFRALLSKGDIRGADFAGAELGEACLRQVDAATRKHLPEASFVGAKLHGADVIGAILVGASFEGATITKVLAEGANFRNARLVGADLRYSDLKQAILDGADVQNADLRWATNLTCDQLLRAKNVSLAYWNQRELSCLGEEPRESKNVEPISAASVSSACNDSEIWGPRDGTSAAETPEVARATE